LRDFSLFWPKFGWLALEICNQKCLLHIGRPWRLPVISNHIFVVSRRNAFICIYINFGPKIGCHGNAPLSLVYGGVKDEFPDSTLALSQNQTLHRYVAYNWSYGHFCDFLKSILAKIWLPWQLPLDPCNPKCLLCIGRRRKPPVISNHILVICHRNAFMRSYSNFCPKMVTMVTPLCPLCTEVSQMNSLMAQTPSQNKTLHGYVAYNWRYGHFCNIFAHFGQTLVAMATSMKTSLRPLQSEVSSFDWPTTKTPVISNRILVISRRNAFVCIHSNFCPKIGCRGNAPLSLVYGSVTDEFPNGTNPISKATSLRPLQSEVSSWDWSTTKTPCYM